MRKNYFSSDHYMYYQYLDYEMTLNQYKDQIESYNKQIKETRNSKIENSKTDRRRNK